MQQSIEKEAEINNKLKVCITSFIEKNGNTHSLNGDIIKNLVTLQGQMMMLVQELNDMEEKVIISDEIYDVITTRHSCRKFQDKQVLDDDIIKIINCGLSAPSAMNKQPWFFVVIKDKRVINNLKNLAIKAFANSDDTRRKYLAKQLNYDPFYNPSVMILICNKKDLPFSKNDCCFAVQNMSIMAESLGLSTCIIQDICWAIDESNKCQFKIPNEYEIYLALSIGYPYVINKNKKDIDPTKYTIIGN